MSAVGLDRVFCPFQRCNAAPCSLCGVILAPCRILSLILDCPGVECTFRRTSETLLPLNPCLLAHHSTNLRNDNMPPKSSTSTANPSQNHNKAGGGGGAGGRQANSSTLNADGQPKRKRTRGRGGRGRGGRGKKDESSDDDDSSSTSSSSDSDSDESDEVSCDFFRPDLACRIPLSIFQ